MKHSEGTWKIRKDENQTFVSVDFMQAAPLWSGDGPSATCTSTKDVAIVAKFRMQPEEREANARLIAAAPQMLEAGKEFVEAIAELLMSVQTHIEDSDCECRICVADRSYEKFRAAIKAAEGGE